MSYSCSIVIHFFLIIVYLENRLGFTIKFEERLDYLDILDLLDQLDFPKPLNFVQLVQNVQYVQKVQLATIMWCFKKTMVNPGRLGFTATLMGITPLNLTVDF